MPLSSFFNNPAIVRLVFAGAGVNAIGYSGANQAIKETGLVNGVQEISGSSSGSITAAMIASGLNPRLVRQRLLKASLYDLLGESDGQIFKKKPGAIFLSKNGKPLGEFIRLSVREGVLNFLNQEDLKGKTEMKNLQKKIQSNPQLGISFAELALLNQYYPEQFKQLTVTAVKYPNGQLKVFSAQETPDLEIHKAAVASSSVPILVQPAMIDGEQYLDGSMYDNVPSEYFDASGTQNLKKQQTLIFCFSPEKKDQKSPIYQALYGPRRDEVSAIPKPVIQQPSYLEHLKGNVLPRLLIGLTMEYDYCARDEVVYQRIREDYPLRTVELHVGNVQTFDFATAKKYARHMDAFGYLDTMHFIINHELYDPKVFSKTDYYSHLVHHFESIYRAVLQGKDQDPSQDPLIQGIEQLRLKLEENPQIAQKSTSDKRAIIDRELYQFLKEIIERELDAPSSFALTRAVERLSP